VAGRAENSARIPLTGLAVRFYVWHNTRVVSAAVLWEQPPGIDGGERIAGVSCCRESTLLAEICARRRFRATVDALEQRPRLRNLRQAQLSGEVMILGNARICAAL
jgi:hypothetical protein